MGSVDNLSSRQRNSQEPRFEIEDRVYIKRDKLAKYVRAVEGVDPSEIEAWRRNREAARGEGEIHENHFLDHVPHPKAAFVKATLSIVEKIPGRFKLARGPSFPVPYIWVDKVDVEDVLINPRGILEPTGLENSQRQAPDESITDPWGRVSEEPSSTPSLNRVPGPADREENGQSPPPVTPEREDK